MKGFAFPIEVVRTDRRRTASIQLEDGLVRVRAPNSLPDSRIRELVNKRSLWIKARLREQAETPAPKPKEYVSGEACPYLGRNYRLKVLRGRRRSIRMQGGYLAATILETDADPKRPVRTLLEGWYRAQAEVRLREKTERLSKVVGVNPTSISVRSYKSRWGSCSSRGDVSYNWKIILAPHRIVDYVVVHELCHLLEHNHSPQYWKLVRRYIPDWRDCRDWLKANPITF